MTGNSTAVGLGPVGRNPLPLGFRNIEHRGRFFDPVDFFVLGWVIPLAPEPGPVNVSVSHVLYRA